jgi:hypothetical protein
VCYSTRNENRASVVLDVSLQLTMLSGMTRGKRHPDLQGRRNLLSGFLVAALAATGCSTLQPTPTPTGAAEPTPTASAQPTPAPSAVAAEPTVSCQTWVWNHTPPPGTVAITLTCENAVAAAKAVVGPDPAVTSIEFKFGLWCPPDRPCLAMMVLNGGYVIFHREGALPDLVVVVTADQAGKVTASGASIVPS